MAMKRRPNNSGTVTRIFGRNKEYWARLPKKVIWDHKAQRAITKRVSLGYFETESRAWKAIAEYKKIHPEDFDPSTKNLSYVAYKVTVQDLWDDFTDSIPFTKLSDSTKGNYNAVWNKYLVPIAKQPITSIKTSALQNLINNIEAKSGTKKNTLTVMRKLMDIAQANDIINKNYAKFVNYEIDDSEIVREVFSADEINKLWIHSDDWLVKIILIMIYSGARITEVVNIKASDVHLEEHYFHIPEGKNKFAIRDVPIHSAIFELLKDLCNKSSDVLLKDENGANLRANRVYSSMDRIKEITGVEHYVYDAKHTFITKCEICNVRELYKINIIGHTPKNTSGKVYTHLPISELCEEIEKVSY